LAALLLAPLEAVVLAAESFFGVEEDSFDPLVEGSLADDAAAGAVELSALRLSVR